MALRLAEYRSHTEPNGENYLGSLRHRKRDRRLWRRSVPHDRRQMVARSQRYDRRAVVKDESVWSAKESTPGFAAKRVNDCINLGVAVNGRCDRRNVERLGGGLKHRHEQRIHEGRGVGIEDQGDAFDARRDLSEQSKPLACYRRFKNAEPSNVAAWMGQARYEARADRVGNKREYDWDGLRLAGKRGGYGGRRCQQHVGLQTDKLFCECVQQIDVAGAPAHLYLHIAAFGPAELSKMPREFREQRMTF